MAEREIDDISKRKLYKDKKFKDKDYIKDSYTGNFIPYDCTDDDHITPIAVIEDRYGDLLKEQQKKIANREYNQALTSSKVNRSKGALENHQYLKREVNKTKQSFKHSNFTEFGKEVHEISQKAPSMLGNEVISRTCMAIEGNYYRAGNLSKQAFKITEEIHKTGMSGSTSAVKSSMVYIIREGIEDIVKVSTYEMTPEDAAKDISLYTAKIAAAGAASNVGRKQIEKIAQQASGKIICKMLSPEIVGPVIAISTTIVNVLVKCINGEINPGQAIDDLVTSGVSQGIQTILFNSVFGIAGAGVFSATAAVLGIMLISSACSYIADSFQSFNNYKEDIAIINKIIQDADREIANIKKTLQEICDRELLDIEEKSKEGYKMIIEAVVQNDIELAEHGMNRILELSKEKVIFSGTSRDEFCAVLFDK